MEPEYIQVRPAIISDLPTLLEFEQGVIEAERPFDPTLKPGQIHYYDLHEMIASEDIQLIVAENEGRLMGSGYARIEESKMFYQHRKHAYLGFMYVLPEYRGQGINRQIIEALRIWTLSKGVNEMRLEVYAGNSPAIEAYKKCGFTSYLIQMRLGL